MSLLPKIFAFAIGVGLIGNAAHAVLVAHYEFEDAASLGLDSAGGDNSGTQQGADSSYSATSRLGQGALYLDATGTGLRLDQPEDFQGLTTFTIASFIRPDLGPEFGGAITVGRIFGALGIDGQGGTQFGTNSGYGYGFFENGGFRYTTFGVQDYNVQGGSLSPPLISDKWAHVAVVVTEGTAEFFLNGASVATIEGDNPTPTTNPFHIGAAGYFNTDPYRGLIDDLRVYDEALDASAVASLAAPGGAGQQGVVLAIDRATGVATLTSDSATPLVVSGYSITTAAGTLDPGGWQSVSANYDQGSGGAFDDDDDWVEFSGTATDLSEGTLGEAMITSSLSLNLGAVWEKSPIEDVAVELLLADGGSLFVPVVLSGNGGEPFRYGDFNFDGDIDLVDYQALSDAMFSDVSGQSTAEAYSMGDINLDDQVDEFDFIAFKDAYLSAGGSLAALEAARAAPEPAAAVLALAGVLAGCAVRRPLRRVSCTATAAVVLACGLGTLTAGDASAQLTPVFEYSFPDSYDGSTTTVTDLSGAGNHGTAAEEAGVGAFELVEETPSGAPAGAKSLDFSNSYGVITTNNTQLLNNAAIAAAGGYTYDLWINPQDAGADMNSFRKIIDYSGTETIGYLSNGAGGLPELRTTMYTPSGVFVGAMQNGLLPNDWNHIQVVFNTSGNTVATDGSLEGNLIVVVNDELYNFGARSKNNFGDGLDRSIGIGHHPNFASEHYRGLLYDPSVYLGAAEYQDPVSLEVNTTTGEVVLTHTVDAVFPDRREIDFYKITSESGAIVVANWNSLEEQGVGGGVPDGDFNGDGSVNAADYTVWRDAFGQSVTLPGDTTPGSVDAEDYDTWRTNYGSQGGGGAWAEAGAVGASVVGESNLTGASLLDDGVTISLGNLFDTLGSQDLDITYHVVGDAGFQQGRVNYSSSAAAVVAPEPTALLLCGLAAGLVGGLRRRAYAAPCSLALLAGMALAAPASAASSDRLYLFGDDGFEGASAGNTVGSGNEFGSAFDAIGTVGAGDLQDVVPYNFTTVESGPVYADVSNRPLAGGGMQLGVTFDGDGDYLLGPRLGLPATSEASSAALVPGPLDYSGITHRGLQLWVNPLDSAVGSALQSVVVDSTQHGVLISAAGDWVMRYAGADYDSGVAIASGEGAAGWSHVMLLQPMAGGSVLYVDGVAVAAAAGGYTATDETPLVVGSNTELDGVNFSGGTTDFFSGTIDNLDMFVMGVSTATSQDWGAFDFATENEFAADALAGYVPGDLNGDGQVTGDASSGDVALFIAGWGTQNLVNDLAVGDLNSRASGDFNFDGVVDLADWSILKEAHPSGAGLSLATLLSAPEPATTGLLVGLLLPWAAGGRRRV